MAQSSWQRADVAHTFLDERRAAIPYGIGHADCLFRFLELAVFGGVKPRA